MITSLQRNILLKHLIVNNSITLSTKSTSPSASSSFSTAICSVNLNCLSALQVNCTGINLIRKSIIINRLYSTEHKHSQSHQHQQQQQKQQQPNFESDLNWLQPDKTLMRYVDDLIDFRVKPRRTWLTVLKVFITMFIGINFGAFMAQLGARLLEKYEIFVRDTEESDD